LDPNTGDPLGYIDGKPSNDYAKLVNPTSKTDLVYNGPGRPTYFGGLRNTFTWRRISLSANITYEMEFYFRRPSINYSNLFAGMLSNGNPGNSDFADRWQKPGDEARTNVPSLVYPANTNRDAFYSMASTLVEKGDNIRLQDIRISYLLPAKENGSSLFKNIQVYCYLNNLGILWRANKYGLDPNYTLQAIAPAFTGSLGFNINF